MPLKYSPERTRMVTTNFLFLTLFMHLFGRPRGPSPNVLNRWYPNSTTAVRNIHVVSNCSHVHSCHIKVVQLMSLSVAGAVSTKKITLLQHFSVV